MTSMHFATSLAQQKLQLVATSLGRDMNIALFGGDRAHIGAMALAQNRPSLQTPGKVSASTSVITVCGHKEDQLAKYVAEQVAVKIDAIVTVSCGIHFDDIDYATLNAIPTAVDSLMNQLFDAIDAQKRQD